MTRPYQVLLFGNSLLIEGVQVGLRNTAELELVRIADSLNDLVDYMQTNCPDAIIFDLGKTPTEVMLDSVRACPAMRLIGLDPQHNTAIVLSSQLHSTLSTNDLTQIIFGG